jgi:hypothetical protein
MHLNTHVTIVSQPPDEQVPRAILYNDKYICAKFNLKYIRNMMYCI